LLKGIIQRLKITNKRDLDKQQELVTYLNEVDKRRNLDWQKTFPWLVEVLNNVV
jgi:hypothetical protein